MAIPLLSFLPVPPSSDFPLANIPFGIVSAADRPQPRPATIVGESVVDLRVLAEASLFDGPVLSAVAKDVFSQTTLNAFMALGRPAWREARSTLQSLLSADGPDSRLRSNSDLIARAILPATAVTNHIQAHIGDYTDFYASKEHATNVGTMFRGKENALMPNWVHLPVGYHGRASSIVVSKTPIVRPSGLILDPATKTPFFSASRKMDFELEVAFFVGGSGNPLGSRIPVASADEHIFGLVLMNDWSARDIQQFEYVPLGPFLGKNFGTTVSPWIVTLDALEAARVHQPSQDPTPSTYLLDDAPDAKNAYNIDLEVLIKPKNASSATSICKSNLKYMYWSFKQQLAHHTINGCNMRPGDLCASGTISGPTPDSFGSLLELTTNGSNPIQLIGTSDSPLTRTFIEDGDEIILRGKAAVKDVSGTEVHIGFGEAAGILLPTKPL